jgi:glycosyltransferase involved in cell wall biosynthesis
LECGVDSKKLIPPKHPVNLAIFFEQEMSIGGNYQQAFNNVLVVKNISSEIVRVVYFTTIKKNVEVLTSYGIDAEFLPISGLNRMWLSIRRTVMSKIGWKFIPFIEKKNYLERTLGCHNIDLVYFTSQSALPVFLEHINYIYTLFDLCHRDYPEFPEVNFRGVFEKRDLLFNAVLPKAIAVFVDSDLGKANAVRYYGLNESRVFVMPFSCSVHSNIDEKEYIDRFINVRLKYDLKVDYVFYPAQFWSHKNHIYLLNGIKELELVYGIVIGVIFSGGDQGNICHVKKYSKDLGLLNRVRFAGFVPDYEMPYLYRQSIALVMPTYFGPTNLPPLEAFRLGVPVLYSDLPGLRDQVGKAALLMNLQDPRSMADHLACLMKDGNLRQSLIDKGTHRLDGLSESNPEKTLTIVLKKFQHCRDCWI